jgi:hypothetical protein
MHNDQNRSIQDECNRCVELTCALQSLRQAEHYHDIQSSTISHKDYTSIIYNKNNINT